MGRMLSMTTALVLGLAACSSGEDADEAVEVGPAAGQADAAPAIQAGQYEARTTLLEFEVAGLPEEKVKTLRSAFADELEKPTAFCLTAEQAQKGREEILKKMAESDCTITTLDMTEAGMTGEMNCKGQGGLSGTVKIAGTSAGGTSSMTLETIQSIPNLPGEGARMKWRTDARRVGECSA
ncbi:DUF3617 family protein [Altererythrobacter salegens]|uniref:DUF3617 family protein n=1 Tax=Croceibacterium salegens TaxID=1737568 RepID=A0A6I4SWG7_9SPHN|nr:DUF3617 domain-containing protein [Croceibacterium salegens]MXO59420.1 DUF3617 family protein [Croceibacterium salegens]